jgi:hypothetical protein
MSESTIQDELNSVELRSHGIETIENEQQMNDWRNELKQLKNVWTKWRKQWKKHASNLNDQKGGGIEMTETVDGTNNN